MQQIQPITTIILVSKNDQTNRKQILYTTQELESEIESTIITSSFPDTKIKYPDYIYFNFKSHFYVSVCFEGRKEWEHNNLALVAITPIPFIHQIQRILFSLKTIYVSQTSMINTKLLDTFLPLANAAFQNRYTSSNMALNLFKRLDTNFITLLKLFLLEYRVLIYASKDPVALSSETILFLLSIVPGVFFARPSTEEFDNLQLPLSLNSERRPVFMHLSIDNFYQMGDTEGVVACVSTPFVLTKSSDYDVVIDISTGRFIYRERSIEKSIEITQTDKLFVYNIKEAITKQQKGLAKGIEGTNEWLFGECTNYILSLLNGLARNRQMFTGERIKKTGELTEVYVDYGEKFVSTFMKTNAFREWQQKMISSECNSKSFERVHPSFSGNIGTNSANWLKSNLNQGFMANVNVTLQEMYNEYDELKRKYYEKKEMKESQQEDSNETFEINESQQMNQTHEIKEEEEEKELTIEEQKQKQREEELEKEKLEKEEINLEMEKMDVPNMEDEGQLIDQDQPIDYFFA